MYHLQVQQHVDNLDDYLIEQRNRDIRTIQRNVEDVNQLMRDINILVSEQKVDVDNIESHINKSIVYTRKTVTELKTAEENQSNSNLLTWIVTSISTLGITGGLITLAILL